VRYFVFAQREQGIALFKNTLLTLFDLCNFQNVGRQV